MESSGARLFASGYTLILRTPPKVRHYGCQILEIRSSAGHEHSPKERDRMDPGVAVLLAAVDPRPIAAEARLN